MNNVYKNSGAELPRSSLFNLCAIGLLTFGLFTACASNVAASTDFLVTTQGGNVINVQHGPVIVTPDKTNPRILKIDDGNRFTFQRRPSEFDEIILAIRAACLGDEVLVEPKSEIEIPSLVLSELADPNCIGQAVPSGP